VAHQTREAGVAEAAETRLGLVDELVQYFMFIIQGVPPRVRPASHRLRRLADVLLACEEMTGLFHYKQRRGAQIMCIRLGEAQPVPVKLVPRLYLDLPEANTTDEDFLRPLEDLWIRAWPNIVARYALPDVLAFVEGHLRSFLAVRFSTEPQHSAVERPDTGEALRLPERSTGVLRILSSVSDEILSHSVRRGLCHVRLGTNTAGLRPVYANEIYFDTCELGTDRTNDANGWVFKGRYFFGVVRLQVDGWKPDFELGPPWLIDRHRWIGLSLA
jgi:hypothetical protein